MKTWIKMASNSFLNEILVVKMQIDGNFIDMIDYKQLNYNNYRSSHNVACHTEHTGLGVKPPIVYI